MGFSGSFFFSFEIGVFGLTFRVTMLLRCNLKIFLPKIIILKKVCACAGEKCQIVSLGTFDPCEGLNIKFFDELAYSVGANRSLICQNI